jgi:hypothetical protein
MTIEVGKGFNPSEVLPVPPNVNATIAVLTPDTLPINANQSQNQHQLSLVRR